MIVNVINLIGKDVQTMKYKIRRSEVKVLKYRVVSSAVGEEAVSLTLEVNGTGTRNECCVTTFITSRSCD